MTMIADARRAKGLTQNQLAEALGVSRRTVGAWETSAARPAAGMQAKIDELLGGIDPITLPVVSISDALAIATSAAELRQRGVVSLPDALAARDIARSELRSVNARAAEARDIMGQVVRLAPPDSPAGTQPPGFAEAQAARLAINSERNLVLATCHAAALRVSELGGDGHSPEYWGDFTGY